LAAEKDLRISGNLSDVSVFVRADAIPIDRLLLILLDDVVKYPPRGRAVRNLSLNRGGVAEISVRDSGGDIAESDLVNIFDRFYRADRARGGGNGGAGLGLAIARWIAEMHGGTIVAESAVGVGSAFHVQLPVLIASLAQEDRDSALPAL
jgi:signal transduction histidine kinase